MLERWMQLGRKTPINRSAHARGIMRFALLVMLGSLGLAGCDVAHDDGGGETVVVCPGPEPGQRGRVVGSGSVGQSLRGLRQQRRGGIRLLRTTWIAC